MALELSYTDAIGLRKEKASASDAKRTTTQKSYSSHNPAGAVMVYVFWAALAVVTATGLILTGGATPMRVAAEKAAVESGDLSALIVKSDGESSDDEDKGRRHTAEEVHEVATNLLLFLAALHVAGVVLESRRCGGTLSSP